VATVPSTVEMDVGLSEPVQAAVNGACERVVEELRARGHVVELLDEPAEPQLWWLPGAPRPTGPIY
jgi:hypothetical protein